MREEEKALHGMWFCPNDPELLAKKAKAHRLSHEFSDLFEDDVEKRKAIREQLLPYCSDNVMIMGPIFFHYGCHTHIGENCFLNTDFTVQDDAEVWIGNDCRFGPGCMIVTPLHPLLAEERKTKVEADGVARCYCKAKGVSIGHDCWFGARVTVLPGVHIGNNCVIGAGSVVSKDIPDNSLAYGVPCHVVRQFSDKDSVLAEIEADKNS